MREFPFTKKITLGGWTLVVSGTWTPGTPGTGGYPGDPPDPEELNIEKAAFEQGSSYIELPLDLLEALGLDLTDSPLDGALVAALEAERAQEEAEARDDGDDEEEVWP